MAVVHCCCRRPRAQQAVQPRGLPLSYAGLAQDARPAMQYSTCKLICDTESACAGCGRPTMGGEGVGRVSGGRGGGGPRHQRPAISVCEGRCSDSAAHIWARGRRWKAGGGQGSRAALARLRAGWLLIDGSCKRRLQAGDSVDNSTCRRRHSAPAGVPSLRRRPQS